MAYDDIYFLLFYTSISCDMNIKINYLHSSHIHRTVCLNDPAECYYGAITQDIYPYIAYNTVVTYF